MCILNWFFTVKINVVNLIEVIILEIDYAREYGGNWHGAFL